VSAGDPVLFRGYRVGEVESLEFDLQEQRMSYALFINEPFDALVTQNTRFWNSGGISLKASADGLDVHIGSLQTVLIGGVAFDLPDGAVSGPPAKEADRYALLPNRDAINQRSFNHYADFVVSFTQSLRGVRPGAPVEYRGIPIGTVQRVMIREMSEQGLKGLGAPIPVLIRVEPARIGLPDTPASVAQLEAALRTGVEHGLRATLQTGNLLTGSSLVALDFHPDQGPAPLGSFAGHTEIPVLAGGIERLEEQISTLLAKLNALPLDPTLRDLDATLVAVRDALEDLKKLLGSDETQAITASIESAMLETNRILDSLSPDSLAAERLNRSLAELTQVLRNLESVTRTLADKPSAVIFSPPATKDPVPQKRSSP
jgi:paraquat-inducible protein B